jgi:hypothetical protein
VAEPVVGGREIEDGHAKSVTAQPFGDGTANPRRTTGHDRCLRAQAVIHLS